MGTREWIAEYIASQPEEKVGQLVGHILSTLFDNQTAGEQAIDSTQVDNGVGFASCDARGGSKAAKAFRRNGRLADWSVAQWTRKAKNGLPRICKYHGQVEIAGLEALLSAKPTVEKTADDWRKDYARIRGLFYNASNIKPGEFDALVKAKVPAGATPAQWVATAKAITVPCRRCGCTGQFVTMVENGKPKGPGGICYRCEGKGHQTEADARRNWGYDRNPRIYGTGGI